MSDLPDWAKDKAREWLERWEWQAASTTALPALAALLVDVEESCVRDFTSEEPCPKCGLGVSARCYGCQMVEQRKALLAEVRRVVELHSCGNRCADEILSRLEKLK